MTRGILAALCAALAVLTCIPAVAEAVEVSATACVEEPFEPVVVFRRGDGHRQAVGQLAEFAVGVAHPHPAAFGIVVHDFTAVEVTAAVGDVQLFAAGHAKHADAVFRLFLAERIFRRNDIGGVKQLHFL